ALSLGGGFVARQTLTAQQPREEKLADPAGPEKGVNGAGPRGGLNQAPPANIDQSLADLEKRLEGALDEVRALRRAVKTTHAGATTFPLKHASAARAAEVLRAAYPDMKIRITTDDGTNTVFIQAGPAETQAVGRLLEALDAKKETTDTKP